MRNNKGKLDIRSTTEDGDLHIMISYPEKSIKWKRLKTCSLVLSVHIRAMNLKKTKQKHTCRGW